jgi:hypothetical protein
MLFCEKPDSTFSQHALMHFPIRRIPVDRKKRRIPADIMIDRCERIPIDVMVWGSAMRFGHASQAA